MFDNYNQEIQAISSGRGYIYQRIIQFETEQLEIKPKKQSFLKKVFNKIKNKQDEISIKIKIKRRS